MKISKRNISTLLIICCCLSGPVHAGHDQGQGKSQDGTHDNELASVAVAPEPSTLWIFLLGSLGLAAALRQRPPQNLRDSR